MHKSDPVDLFTPETLSCPHAAWARLRREAPIAQVHPPGMDQTTFAITRKADLEYIAKRPELFSSLPDETVWRWGQLAGDFAPIFKEGYKIVQTIVTNDPPHATRYRRIINEGLGAQHIRRMHGEIQAIVDDLVAAIPTGVPVDFREAFAIPLPLRVIALLLGLPAADARFLFDFTNDYMALVDPSTPHERALEHARAIVSAQHYLAPRILAYREEPAENLLSIVANARNDEGSLLDIAECLSIAMITVVGGNETTRNALAIAACQLADQPAIWRMLKADPAKVPAFVEEVVRLGGPATTTPRRVVADTDVNGVTLPRDATLFMMWGSGSRDEAAFECPAELRLDRRNGRDHTSFGSGLHNCAGAALARLELRLAVESWLRSYDTMAFAVPRDQVVFEPAFIVQALTAVPLIVTPAV